MKSKWWLIGLLVALALVLISPQASGWPDGLERVAEDLGFIDAAQDASFRVIPDYRFPGVKNEAVATVLAGIAGTLLVFGLAYLLERVLRRHEAK
jgi:hypothetical protein